MTTKKKSPYSFKVILEVIRNGLFLQGVRHAFAKIGIDIMPYYWVEEEVIPTEKPILKTDQLFSFRSLKKEDLSNVLAETDSITETKIHKSFTDGQECVGLINEGTIAAYMFIELNDFEIKNRKFKLNTDEAYLLNMYTLPNFRGKNLAPYLRYTCYRHLEKKGITTKYSVSNYFNKSAIKFKKKLNSKPQKLYINIELFKLIQWNLVLKSYP
ncbi:GNAT family N-acetyltransferase [Psychroserpens mesophilus]|uniref:GNAT family N-acetyltransferase n=1 Tax=Psychroserpens mesophilus TaxID=325473 RepID=UPI003D648920